MIIEILSFGKIAEIIENQKIELSGISNTDELKSYLESSFPNLKNIKYNLSLNKDMIRENRHIANNDTVALMPPFSGG